MQPLAFPPLFRDVRLRGYCSDHKQSHHPVHIRPLNQPMILDLMHDLDESSQLVPGCVGMYAVGIRCVPWSIIELKRLHVVEPSWSRHLRSLE
jgi:hypothetical protein